MTNIQEVLESQKRIEDNLLSKISEFESQLLSAAASNSKPNLEKLTQDFNDFKMFVSSMFKLMNTQIQSLMSQVDYLDNQQRRNALLFGGIPEGDKEDCAETIIKTIHTKLNLTNISASTVYVCHRLGAKAANKTRPIIVRFTDINTRNIIWHQKKLLKSTSIVISEFLTKPRQAIFSSGRRHFGINNCWSQDGNIFVKLPNNDRKRISTAKELEFLIGKFPTKGDSNTVHPKVAPSSGTSSSPAAGSQTIMPEPPSTRNRPAKAKPNKK